MLRVLIRILGTIQVSQLAFHMSQCKRTVGLADGTLSRTQKAAISIVLAAANRTKQGVALFTAIARTAGIPEERARQFAVPFQRLSDEFTGPTPRRRVSF